MDQTPHIRAQGPPASPWASRSSLISGRCGLSRRYRDARRPVTAADGARVSPGRGGYAPPVPREHGGGGFVPTALPCGGWAWGAPEETGRLRPETQGASLCRGEMEGGEMGEGPGDK
ncbi:hypothetical protein AAFF_G00436010 [Aldrovandia affinis]|uniref:Uncharacterized protein n=1 Tax=Aldrovandia affinis TaxID=143900 RepID=A0AAD7WHY2_9TELE|nr:hypothetical protein AAFF_G00436010 [Aldrovandia affinis]